jgi:serine phosphatase RsbU (regulator of sigma subunit)
VADGDGEIDGVFAENEYRHINTKLEVGDVFVIYGNGFAQSTFPGGDVVGHHRLVSALQEAPHTDPEARLKHLIGLIQKSNVAHEDSTILVCRVTNSAVSMRDNLLAPLRLLRRPQDNTTLS